MIPPKKIIPRNIDNPPTSDSPPLVPDKEKTELLGSTGGSVDPGAIDKNKRNLKSLTTSAAKLVLRGIKESADAFPPLKSVAGCLCFILDNYEVRFSPPHLPL